MVLCITQKVSMLLIALANLARLSIKLYLGLVVPDFGKQTSVFQTKDIICSSA
jgi:hypothetical protein